MVLFRRKKKQSQRARQSQGSETSPAPVFSYHSRRSSQPQNERTQPSDSSPSRTSQYFRHWWQHLPTLAAILIILAAIGYSLTLSNSPKVVILGENSTNALRGDANEYQKLMQQQLSKSLFYRSKLTLDTNKLTRELKAAYPEFSDLAVVLPLIGRRPVVQVKPAEGTFILKNSRGAYLVDQNGRAVLVFPPEASLPSTVPVVADQTNLDLKSGQTVLPKESLSFMHEVIGQFKAKGLQIESITLPARANELHIKLSGQSYVIKFNMDGAGREQVGTYLALADKLKSEGITLAEYIDVRVEGKAYYR